MNRMLAALLAALSAALLAQTADAQSQGPATSLPRPDFRFKGQIGRTYEDSDPATFPAVVRPPKGAPNVVLILLDDAGYGQFSAFGGGVPSPNIEKLATGYDGYTGIIPKSAGTVSEILRQNGYATAWIGKNHNTPAWETSEVGPFDRWPSGLGFDYFYGFNSGDTSQFEPVLFENRNRVPRSSDPNYHLSTDLADHAISWMQRAKAIDPA